MASSIKEENKFRIINFGCWNQDATYTTDEDKNPDFPRVIESIVEQNGNIIIVNGDNYYQPEENKEKFVIPSQITAGLDILYSATQKSTPPPEIIYLLTGNHDLEKTRPVSNTSSSEPICETILIEKRFADGKNITLPTELVMFKIVDMGASKTLIIMIDTNMYADENLECYDELFTVKMTNTSSRESIIAELQQRQINVINEYMRLNPGPYSNVICCGHHPLACFKKQKKVEKEGKIKIKGGFEAYSDAFYSLFWNNIKQFGNEITRYYYLCSDYHSYQEGTIIIDVGSSIMTIQQYIVGTGGTDLDEPYDGIQLNKDGTTIEGIYRNKKDIIITESVPQASAETKTLEYIVNPLEYKKENGYVVVDITDAGVDVRFVTVGPSQKKISDKKLKKNKGPEGGSRKLRRKTNKKYKYNTKRKLRTKSIKRPNTKKHKTRHR
uniref:Calcineurin-like phosphoesterase domain-containing protein n=1 Tax=viral metagenome TaxID=1070528 RepID=A0A6C0I957_9ZZZZ